MTNTDTAPTAAPIPAEFADRIAAMSDLDRRRIADAAERGIMRLGSEHDSELASELAAHLGHAHRALNADAADYSERMAAAYLARARAIAAE